MYCHAMATLALCEGYALTGDAAAPRIRPRGPSLSSSVRARGTDGLAIPAGRAVGDTSILGWVVMALKSAKEVGIPIPDEASVRRGTLAWLDKVAAGQAGGLASYQPDEPVTPTMTAEAWVCRQFLGVGGPGPPAPRRPITCSATTPDRGPDQLLLLVLRHTGPVPARRRALDALERHGPRPDRRPPAQLAATAPEAGTPTRASTEPRAAGSTARRWPP